MSDARPRGRRRPYDADRPPRKIAAAPRRPSSRPVCRNVTVTESYSLSVAESAYGAELAIANPNLAPVQAFGGDDRGFSRVPSSVVRKAPPWRAGLADRA